MTQGEIRDYFLKTIQKGKNSHALILQGEGGSDWKELAGEYAAMLQCEEKMHCGTCLSCRAYASGNHPDIIRVTHEKADSIGVDEIRRQLVDDMQIRPYRSPWKVYLVDDAEKMTVQAQNALLKTIEEPPSYGVVVLLTTNAEQLLPTIRSRCVLLQTQGQSQGDGLAEEAQQLILSLLHDPSSWTVSRLAEAARQLKEDKTPGPALLAFLRLWYRDVLVWKASDGQGRLLLAAERGYYPRAAASYSYAALEQAFREFDAAERRLASNVNYELTLEELFFHLKP